VLQSKAANYEGELRARCARGFASERICGLQYKVDEDMGKFRGGTVMPRYDKSSVILMVYQNGIAYTREKGKIA
jgi:hypothetical protein